MLYPTCLLQRDLSEPDSSSRRGSPLLRVITRLNIGGPARQALLLTRELEHEFPTILAAGMAPSDEGELGDPSVDVMRVPLQRSFHPLRDVQATSAIRGLIRKNDIRIVHTHMAKAGAVARLASLSSRRRPRTVHTFHGHVLEGYFSPRVQAVYIRIERFLARHTDVLIAVSPEIRDQLLDLGIGAPSQYEVVPLGFDLSSFLSVSAPSGALRSTLGIEPGVALVGVLGRLAPIKDHSTLLKAIARLEAVHLAILGDGECRPSLVQETRSLGIADRVHFVGWRHDVADVLSDMDVVALTSRNEGSPVSLIESLASARPVVATDVGGVRSVVRDGETGYIVQSGDDRAVAERLSGLLADGELRRTMGERGRADVRNRYSKERLVTDLKSLYESLV